MKINKSILIIITLLFYGITTAQTYGAIGYIKAGATGNGTSWSDASGDLQALINTRRYSQIWVAGGTYKPNRKADDLNTITPNNQHNAFVISGVISIYGGFAGTEVSLNERNLSLASNESILSGDLGIEQMSRDNAYHVVILSGYATLDGLTIANGVASCYGNCITVDRHDIDGRRGGGIYTIESKNTISNVTIRNNWAEAEGGGMYLGRSPDIRTNLTLINTVFWNNSTTGKGGAIFALSSQPKITNCVFSGNYAQNGGGGICARESLASIYNTIFHQNNARWETLGHDIFVDDYNYPVGTVFIYPDVHYSILQNYRLNAYYNNNYVGNYQPFKDPLNGDFTLTKTSFSVYDTGTNSVPGITLPTRDKAGNQRIVNQIIDRGAYEYKSYRTMKEAPTQKKREDKLLLFPNPASDDLNIEIESDIKQMVIYNEQGQQVFLGTQKKENISCLNNGVYTIKIEDEQGEIRTTKFLKK
ncbi:T9SS type A sorting domain-containing protein [Flavobacterium columnare]|uniref:T9SS C-terminal target domain-containing protein n=1 Tax=Flavobacterium columnare TaxID=996 RepID=A0A437U829_9FLAO|nr:T9SS type A sorting domain-containing protein [Flavobacterium columnare]RVU89766.1 T9SS C-terminal target domain-containing protein [Flavobacterium columnare]